MFFVHIKFEFTYIFEFICSNVIDKSSSIKKHLFFYFLKLKKTNDILKNFFKHLLLQKKFYFLLYYDF